MALQQHVQYNFPVESGPSETQPFQDRLPLDVSGIVKQYISDVINVPPDQGISLDEILRKALVADSYIRSFFASNSPKPYPSDPHLGLIDVFSIAPEARRSRPRLIKPGVLSSNSYVFPLPAANRRQCLEPSMVPDIETFRTNWNVFSHGVLSAMTGRDWKNIVVAGGSVLACLLSIKAGSLTELNTVFQGSAWAASDIDVFIWGLSEQEARLKIEAIHEAIRTSVAIWPVVCVRKANTISIHTDYPRRPVQIILRLYTSPAEILAGFDVDAACCAFDGQNVWVNPRSLTAIIRQANTVDMTRRSPSYEVRLAKYAERGFEVYIPSLSRRRIDPQIYNRNLVRFPNGLARLLVLERLRESYYAYKYLKYPKTRVNSGKEVVLEAEDPLLGMKEDAPSLPKSYYEGELRHIQIPYGPLWTAERIARVIRNKDRFISSPSNKNNKGRRIHKHVIFAGSVIDCITGNFCEECRNVDGQKTVYSEDGTYIQGAVSFLTTNPGRQMITGSFHPIDDGEWEEEAYLPPGSEGEVLSDERDPIYAIWALLHPGFKIE